MPRGGKIGNKGGGRKTAYVEEDNAKKLLDAYFNGVSQADLEKKIESGNFSIWDRTVLCALEGDTKILNLLGQKVFPDQLVATGNAIVPVKIKINRQR